MRPVFGWAVQCPVQPQRQVRKNLNCKIVHDLILSISPTMFCKIKICFVLRWGRLPIEEATTFNHEAIVKYLTERQQKVVPPVPEPEAPSDGSESPPSSASPVPWTSGANQPDSETPLPWCTGVDSQFNNMSLVDLNATIIIVTSKELKMYCIFKADMWSRCSCAHALISRGSDESI